MPERGFDTGFWTDDFVMGLTYPAKLLFHYLGSNDDCNQASVYHNAPKTIIFETGLPESDLPSLLKMLYPEVKWLPEENIVWVKNFIAHQAKSPKFLVAVGNCLKKIRNNALVAEVLEYNLTYHTLSIPYEYPTDRVSILPVSVSNSKSVSSSSSDKDSSLFGSFSLLRSRLLRAASGAVDHLVEHEMIKQELTLIGREQGLEPRSEYQTASGRVDLCFFDSQGELVAAFEIDVYEPRAKSLTKLAELDCPLRCVILRTGESQHSVEQDIHLIGLGIRGGIETGKDIPHSRTEAEETLCEGDREVISVWCSVKGFNMTPADASALVARLRTEFPGLDILAQSKVWAARKLSEPLTKNSRPSQQIWNWMVKGREIAQERRQHEQVKGQRVKGSRPASDFRGRKW